MKALIILLLFSLSLCEIEYTSLKATELSTNLKENTINGEFTACIACLQDEDCKKVFYEEILYDLTDEYDKEDVTLEACQSLSGNVKFDRVIKQHLARSEPPLLNKRTLRFKKISPKIELKRIELDTTELELRDDLVLKSLKSWIKDRLNKLADKAIDKIHDALTGLVDKFTDWLREKTHAAIDKI